MASEEIHYSQAEHNERVAKYLLNAKENFYDWAITICFYSAIHYFEYFLCKHPLFVRGAKIYHTETSIPLNEEGRLAYTPHKWREELISKGLKSAKAKMIYKIFRKLRATSEILRYLSHFKKEKRKYEFINIPAIKFISREEANKLYDALQIYKRNLFELMNE